MTPPFSWGTPGIDKAPPTSAACAAPVPTHFRTLSFNPQGVYDLRRMLGALPSCPGEYTAHKKRFDAADVAWFAAGCSTDNHHSISSNEFHPVMASMYLDKFGPDCRRDLKDLTQSLLFDVATLLDRAFGGSTMVVHFDCRTSPGTPAAPEYLKAKVYLPPSTVISEIPDAHGPLASIVQTFIEQVALHTKLRWERVGKASFGWKLSAKNGPPNPLPLTAPFVTATPPGSSIYTFNGRPFSQAHHAASPSTSAITISSESSISVQSDVIPDDGDDDDMYVGEEPSSYMAAFNMVDWKIERQGYKEREEAYKHDIACLKQHEKELKDRIRELEQDHIKLQLELAHETGLRNTAAVPRNTAAPPTVHSPFALEPTTPHPPLPSSFSGTAPSPFAHMGTPKRKAKTKEHGTPTTSIMNKTKLGPITKPEIKSPFTQVLTGRDATVHSSQHSSSSMSFHQVMSDSSSASHPDEFTGRIGSNASRATFLAKTIGYSTAMSTVLDFIVAYVPPAFWSKELTKNGFKDEDLDSLLGALVNDQADLR